ncbi:hypothetical protein PISL3812_06278 [Talaromyces islandicus]|uniref:Uncharacterized protein n=1 Tax=Talaromyces islandicus TaxID=28573 RepID=A0A0U1M1D8_TALIS|nr:hypothetical protein PISL3812_06278 [Talaromyces islandicus]
MVEVKMFEGCLPGSAIVTSIDESRVSPTPAGEKMDLCLLDSRAVDQDPEPVWKRLVQSLERVDIPSAS